MYSTAARPSPPARRPTFVPMPASAAPISARPRCNEQGRRLAHNLPLEGKSKFAKANFGRGASAPSQTNAMTPPPPLLRISCLVVRYGAIAAVRGVDLDVADGEI